MDSENKKNNSEDEISLIDLFAVLWHRKKMIITVVVTAAIGIVLFSIISMILPPEISFLPNYYTPRATLLINNDSSSGGLSSMLNNVGSGLSSLMGLSASLETDYNEIAIFIIETNTFLDAVVDEFDMLEKLIKKNEKSPRAASRKELKKLLKAELDSTSGTLSIRFKDIDPVYAKNVVNFCVAHLEKRFGDLGLDKNRIEKENLEINIANAYDEILKLEEDIRRLEQSVAYGTSYSNLPAITIEVSKIGLELEAKRQVYTQLRVQYELNKVKIASESPMFQVLEYADVLDQKSGPSRGLICIIVVFAAGFLSVFIAFALNAVSNIKKDPQAMAKIRGEQ